MATLALAFALSSCFPGNAFIGDPVQVGEFPTDLQPDPPEVSVEVHSIGLGGHVAAGQGPTVVHLSLSNRGRARRVEVSFEEVVREASMGIYSVMTGRLAPLEVALGAGEEKEISWTVPVLNDGLMNIAPEDGGIFAVVRDRSGRILGAARAPRTERYGMPVVVLTGDDEVGIAVQNEIFRALSGVDRPPVAIVTRHFPTHFWEYAAASLVVLARRIDEFSPVEQIALRRFVAYGGTVVVPPDLADQTDGLALMNHGIGRVVVLEPGPTSYGEDLPGQWRRIVNETRNQGGMTEANLPLQMHIELPDTRSLLGMIGLIVLLVGPALHIVLARMRKREWAWVGVPVLSVVLAGGMYFLASGAKGAANGVEVQHLHVSLGDAQDALVMTQVRVQSKKAVSKTVRIVGPEGSDPRHDNLERFLYSGGVFFAPAVKLEKDVVEVGPLAMHRWSSQDLATVCAGERVPLEIEQLAAGGVRIVNTSGMTLTEVDYQVPGGWNRIAPSLAPGAVLEIDEPPVPDPDPLSAPLQISDDQWSQAYARSSLLATAGSVPRVQASWATRVLARCEAPGQPEVEVIPAADRVADASWCLWIVPVDQQEGGSR